MSRASFNMSATARKHQCQQCSRAFDRKDTLTRHIQVHDTSRVALAPRQKSCFYCSKSKIKCSGTLPSCQSCTRRNIYCDYPALAQQRTLQARKKSLASAYESIDQSSSLPISVPENLTPPPDSSNVSDMPYHTAYSGDIVPAPQPHDSMFHLEPITSSQNGTLGHENQYSPVGEFTFESMGFMDLSHFTPNTGLDWMFFNAVHDDSSGSHLPALSSTNLFEDMSHAITSSSHQQIQPRMVSSPIEDESLVQNQSPLSMDPKLNARAEPPSNFPHNCCDPDDPWPMEWYATSLLNSELPMLGRLNEPDLDGSSFFGMTPITDQTRERMKDATRLSSGSTMWPELDIGSFPSKEKLDHCIDLYFAHFHHTLPIIHRPTFSTEKHPVALTLAISCIGACYTGLEGARPFSNSLSELNRRLLLFMSEQDRRFVRTEFYVAAQLLQGTHGYSSGNKRLFELSDAFRSSLVNNARCMGLFQDRPKTTPVDDSMEARWHAWISDERLCRLAWAVYEYDSSVSYLHNTRPFLSVSEINLTMPSPLPLWEAETVHVWLSLHPWTKSLPRNPSFRPIIHTLFNNAESDVGSATDFQHQLIVLNTLTRTLWSVKEFEASAVNDFIRGAHALTECKNHVQEVLDRFLYTQPPKTRSKAELSFFVRKSQIIHMSHLYSAGDLMDWIRPLLRGGPGADAAMLRAEHWGKQDAIRVRRVAFHSAQVLSLARRYLQNEPLEAFNVFHTGIVLWCVTGLLTKYSRESHSDMTSPPCRLDDPAYHRGTISQASLDWIRAGGAKVVSMRGVPNLLSRGSQMLVLEQTASILENMHVWGIAHNFLLVVSQMIQRESPSSPF